MSKFPAIRRDIAIVVDDKIPASELAQVAAAAAPDLIQRVTIFDVYQGPGIEAGLKSVALGLILQETSRTLTDDDADSAMDAAVTQITRQICRGIERLEPMALTKADMAESLFNELGLNKREARELVDLYFEELRASLAVGEQIKLSGFGNFDLRDKNERPGRNPKDWRRNSNYSTTRVLPFAPDKN